MLFWFFSRPTRIRKIEQKNGTFWQLQKTDDKRAKRNNSSGHNGENSFKMSGINQQICIRYAAVCVREHKKKVKYEVIIASTDREQENRELVRTQHDASLCCIYIQNQHTKHKTFVQKSRKYLECSRASSPIYVQNTRTPPCYRTGASLFLRYKSTLSPVLSELLAPME